MTRFALARAGALSFLLIGSACSGGSDDDGGDDNVQQTAPVINAFTVSSDFVQANDAVIVSWDVSRATEVSISQNDGRDLAPVTSTTVVGSQSFVIVRDTEFVIVATNAMGETAMATATVDVDGIRIDAFTASATSVNRLDRVDLSWMIGGEDPSSVSIDDDQGNNVYQGTMAQGSLEVRPAATVTYTLTAEGSTGTETAEVTITVASNRPTIVRFVVEPDNVVQINVEEANLVWETTADEVQVLQDGVAVRPWNSFGASAGNLQRPVTTEMTVFTLQARNTADPEDIVEESVTVTGLATPTIVSFTVTPLEYTESSTMATISWEVETTDTVEIRLNNTVLPGFPSTDATGSVTVPITGEPRVRLLATNPVTTVEQTQQIVFGFDEREPNDSAIDAIPIEGNGMALRGTISDPTDVDWYVVDVPQDVQLNARVGIVQVMGIDVCSFDTFVRVYTSTLAEIGSNDNGPTSISPCSEISPIANAFAEQMDAGTYYIAVSGTGTTPQGQYSIVVEFSPVAPPALPLTNVTAVGNPTWSVTGLQMWEGPVGATGELVPPDFDMTFADYHAFAAFGLISILSQPLSPLPRSNYDNVLALFLHRAGYTATTTFPTTSLLNGNAIYIGMTLVPNGTAPVGPSFDSVSGPIIPNAAFPIVVNMTIRNGAADYLPVDPLDLPSYAGYAAAGLPPVPNPGNGDGHRHLISLIADSIAPTPGGNLVGSYTWNYQLRDATNAGYDIVVPFTVQ